MSLGSSQACGPGGVVKVLGGRGGFPSSGTGSSIQGKGADFECVTKYCFLKKTIKTFFAGVITLTESVL